MASVIPSAPLGTDAAAGSIGLGAASVCAPSGVAAERRFRFELAAHPGSPAQARRLTRARLTGWSVCEDTCDTAALVVSELVTNAIVHTASSHIVCELHDGGELVRIAVRDEGCAPGQPRANTRQQPEDEHGRGLLLVDALCHSWGAHENGPGLLVWADLPRAAEAGGTVEPTDDLGWGARPKPGPPGTPDDDPANEPDRPHDPAAGNRAHTPPLPPHQRTPRPRGRA
ncbi:ATP-binding protein [Streptomyces sp. NPDC057236]|uniref:ATP-binding protein n=1 Tax=Streptomyces sp. NPDC057236 TaxID=3346059 RepID=UPI0036406D9E